MTATDSLARDGRLAVWCGWVWTVAAGLLPLLAWAWPLGFSVIVPAAGILCLPAVRIRRSDAWWLAPLFLLLGWALVSSTWSPFAPDSLDSNTAVKLAVQLPVYLWAFAGARAADEAGRTRALQMLGWASVATAALILIEAASGAALYSALRQAIGDPIRPDLAVRNVAQGVFVLALAGWLGVYGLPRRLRPWAALLVAVAVIVGGVALHADAPVLAMGLGLLVAGAVWKAQKAGAIGLATVFGGLMIVTPFLVAAMDLAGWLNGVKTVVPLSWEQRIGYWQDAIVIIAQAPLAGNGLDASRALMAANLHPHNAALQIWMELGAVGAIIAAWAWAAVILGLRRIDGRFAVACVAATAATYFVFGAFSFGVWQEWWLSLAAFAGAFSALALRKSPPVTSQASTAPPSEG